MMQMEDLFDIIRASSAPEQYLVEEVSYLFDGMDTVPNPLVAVRALDDASQEPFSSADERARALEDFEVLSLRLWHMATTLSIGRLSLKLADEPDRGEADLKLLEGYAKIICPRTQTSSKPQEQEYACDINIDELMWPVGQGSTPCPTGGTPLSDT